jgi:hypothetical protein
LAHEHQTYDGENRQSEQPRQPFGLSREHPSASKEEAREEGFSSRTSHRRSIPRRPDSLGAAATSHARVEDVPRRVTNEIPSHDEQD